MESVNRYLDITSVVTGLTGVLGNGLVCVVIAKVPATEDTYQRSHLQPSDA